MKAIKATRKIFALLLALVMMMGFSITIFAQDVSGGSGSGTITISNAAKGETYEIYKLFDASVTGAADGSIVYTGDIPSDLEAYFSKSDSGYISATDAAYADSAAKSGMSDGLRSALADWTNSTSPLVYTESDGSQLNFTGLSYGYYVVTTTQGKQAITVDSTNPTATIVDKNSTTPSGLEKTVDDTDVNIGDTVTYTVTFITSNYDGSGTAAKKILSYTIKDTLPDFLEDVTVNSIIVDNDGNSETTNDQSDVTAQFYDKEITLNWYDEDNDSFYYDNGATVTITYTAVVSEDAEIDGDGNTNKVTVSWTLDDETTKEEELEETETIYTYAIALKKIDGEGNPLAGAVFQLPFFVKTTPDTDGAYIYAGIKEGEGLTNTLTTLADGLIIVKGVASGTYEIRETQAPAGYNRRTDPVEVTATQTGNTTTNSWIILDENGNIVDNETSTTQKVTVTIDDISASVEFVVNKAGTALPSTGGTGTTMIYIIGAVLVIGAGVLLVVHRRMSTK